MRKVQKFDANVFQLRLRWVNFIIVLDFQMKIMAQIDRNLIQHFPFWDDYIRVGYFQLRLKFCLFINLMFEFCLSELFNIELNKNVFM